ncbi:hypothetical protein PPYR_10565 [Photinus pyralis]|uniref:Palmitoyltransferase n=2 Tax=Photinus pyralis TaxID=7054 RepID=A0A5N4AGP9_PHOPY|nr:palmitoyltransferase ZDHHC15B-like [Photinus pyralis]KAB0796504.1 hypothetical protein PPYR_10565 [Photinus pyralis]
MPQEIKDAKSHSCIRAAKWIPVLFIMLITFWSYYVYVVEFCLYTVDPFAKKVTYMVVYHVVFFMFYWTYFKTICTGIGTVPDQFKLPDGEYDRLMHADSEEMARSILETFASVLPTTNYTVGGSVRYCKKCRHIKPDRSHHCSVCGECVLKMDHHCPWINNCVGFTNYKYFVLFLCYSLAYCLFITATTAQYFVRYWTGKSSQGHFQILFLFFVGITFTMSLVTLTGYHFYLTAHNRTTLEAFRPVVFYDGPDKNGYDMGTCTNFHEVFGDCVVRWFFPVAARKGDGLSFAVRSRIHNYDAIDSSHSSSERS